MKQLKLVTAGWWESLSLDQKKAYITDHPNSKYAGKTKTTRDSPSAVKKAKDEKPLSKGTIQVHPKVLKAILDFQDSYNGGPAKKLRAIAKDIPPELKVISSKPHYRGMNLPKSFVYDLIKGKTLKLKPKEVSSWATDDKVDAFAGDYGDKKIGVVFKKVLNPDDVIISSAQVKKYVPKSELSSEFIDKEVVMKGESKDSTNFDASHIDKVHMSPNQFMQLVHEGIVPEQKISSRATLVQVHFKNGKPKRLSFGWESGKPLSDIEL